MPTKKTSTKASGTNTTTPKAKAKSSKTTSTRQKNTAPGKPKAKTTTKAKKTTFKRKDLPIEELHPFSAFPFRLEYQDGKDKRVCHFECEQHRDKHIARYNMRKGSYVIDNLT